MGVCVFLTAITRGRTDGSSQWFAIAMRGLNLTRLARSSEGRHFKDVQAQQTSKLRKNLSKEQLADAGAKAAKAAAAPTVDTVVSIAGHSAYSRLAAAEVDAPAKVTESVLFRRLRNPDPVHLKSSQLQAGEILSGPDPSVVKVLSQNRMAILARAQSNMRTARALPGSEKKAEGAVLGLQAFVTATAVVGSIGIAGVLYLYLNPSAVDNMKRRSVQFRERVEGGSVGAQLRKTADGLRKDGGLLSTESSTKAGIFARKVVGVKPLREEEVEDSVSK